MCVELAVATGVPPAVWAHEGPRAIATALETLQRLASARRRDESDEDEPLMSG